MRADTYSAGGRDQPAGDGCCPWPLPGRSRRRRTRVEFAPCYGRPRLHSAQQGFTLIEVLVALLIISLSLTTIAVTMGSMLDTATSLRERTYASWIAQNRIVEIRASGTVPEVGESSGEVEYANTDWEWRAVISETGIENLMRVDVSVSRPGAADPVRSVTGFVGEPVIPGQANRIWIAGTTGPAGADDGTDDDGATN